MTLLNQYEAAEHQIDKDVTDLAKSDQSKTVFDQPSYILYPIDKPQGKRSYFTNPFWLFIFAPIVDFFEIPDDYEDWKTPPRLSVTGLVTGSQWKRDFNPSPSVFLCYRRVSRLLCAEHWGIFSMRGRTGRAYRLTARYSSPPIAEIQERSSKQNAVVVSSHLVSCRQLKLGWHRQQRKR